MASRRDGLKGWSRRRRGQLSGSAQAPSVTDGAGRRVTVPAKVERVFPVRRRRSSSTRSLPTCCSVGRAPIGRRNSNSVARHRQPARGPHHRRGNTPTRVRWPSSPTHGLGFDPPDHLELADWQAQTGVPYALLDGRFERIPASYLTLGELVGRRDRARELARYAEEAMSTVRGRCLAVPPERRPRVYYGRGPAGLETGLSGSINVEVIEFLGLRNVAAELPRAACRGAGLALGSRGDHHDRLLRRHGAP
jgi:iron complex transport system substrate-binding protein